MRRIQVITQKELVDSVQLKDCTVVVIDVFLATSTIAVLLKNNYEPIFAMEDASSAKDFAEVQTEPYILLGESKGNAVEGFEYPDPTLITPSKHQTSAIICSTNGTRAIESAKGSKVLYVSSLVNGHLIAQRLHESNDDSSIVIICSGNDNRFSMEDFVGAGQLISHLSSKGDYLVSDSAVVAKESYLKSKSLGFKDLYESETATFLSSTHFTKSIEFVINNHEKVDVIPIFTDNKIMNDYKRLDKVLQLH
ncbi:2-phosphosulfolactate phosphatase [Sporosarcina sp. CAU 1771]